MRWMVEGSGHFISKQEGGVETVKIELYIHNMDNLSRLRAFGQFGEPFNARVA